MSGRFGKLVAGALVAAGMAVMFTPTANAASARAAAGPVKLKDCSRLARGALKSFHQGAVGHWRVDPQPGGCIQTAQQFINDTFQYARFFAAASPPSAEIHDRLFALDLGWWPLHPDGNFGRSTTQDGETTRAVMAYRKYAELAPSRKLTWQMLDSMNTDCIRAKRALGYQTSACDVPPTSPRQGPN